MHACMCDSINYLVNYDDFSVAYCLLIRKLVKCCVSVDHIISQNYEVPFGSSIRTPNHISTANTATGEAPFSQHQ